MSDGCKCYGGSDEVVPSEPAVGEVDTPGAELHEDLLREKLKYIEENGSSPVLTGNLGHNDRTVYGNLIKQSLPSIKAPHGTKEETSKSIRDGIQFLLALAMDRVGDNHSFQAMVEVTDETELGGGYEVEVSMSTKPFNVCEECGRKAIDLIDTGAEKICPFCYIAALEGGSDGEANPGGEGEGDGALDM